MARQIISKDQITFHLSNKWEFRWGKLTAYTDYQGDYLVKHYGELVACLHEDDRVWLDELMDDKVLPVIRKGLTLALGKIEAGTIISNEVVISHVGN